MGVELAPKVQSLAALPAVPDGAHGQHEFAHARCRAGPGRAEAALDVRPDLGSEPEDEAPAREELQVEAQVGERHRIARERDRDRGGEFEALRMLGCDDQGQERVVGSLEREAAVVSGRLERLGAGSGVAGVVDQNRAVELHRGAFPRDRVCVRPRELGLRPGAPSSVRTAEAPPERRPRGIRLTVRGSLGEWTAGR